MSETVPHWINVASQELGISEIVGLDNNKRIIQYHSETSLKATTDEVPWCSSFVNWVMKQCHVKGTYSAAARSWMLWGYPCELRNGAICVLKRGDNQNQGHVGFVVGWDDNFVHILGGNQSNKVCVQKFALHDVLDYRWPFKVIT